MNKKYSVSEHAEMKENNKLALANSLLNSSRSSGIMAIGFLAQQLISPHPFPLAFSAVFVSCSLITGVVYLIQCAEGTHDSRQKNLLFILLTITILLFLVLVGFFYQLEPSPQHPLSRLLFGEREHRK